MFKKRHYRFLLLSLSLLFLYNACSSSNKFSLPPPLLKDPFRPQKTLIASFDHEALVAASSDRKNIAYFAAQDDGIHLIVNGKVTGPTYNFVKSLNMSEDGSGILIEYQDNEHGLSKTIYNGEDIKSNGEDMESKTEYIADYGLGVGKYKLFFKKGTALITAKKTIQVYSDHQTITQSYENDALEIYPKIWWNEQSYNGVTPSGKHFAYILKDYQKGTHAVLDGKKGPKYLRIDFLQFSPSENYFCYRASRENQWFNVCNGKEGPAYNQITQLEFTPDESSYSYIGISKQGQQLVYGNQKSPFFDYVIGRQIYSPDGKSLFYSVKKGNKSLIYQNNQVLAEYDYIGKARIVDKSIDLSALKKAEDHSTNKNALKSKHEQSWALAFLAKNKGEYFWIVDGEKYQLAEKLPQEAQLSDQLDYHSMHLLMAKISYRGTHAYIINGKIGPKFQEEDMYTTELITQHVTKNTHGSKLKKKNWFSTKKSYYDQSYTYTLSVSKPMYLPSQFLISPDGKNVAYLIKREKKFFLVVNGKIIKDQEILFQPAPKFSPDSQSIAYFCKQGKSLYWIAKATESFAN